MLAAKQLGPLWSTWGRPVLWTSYVVYDSAGSKKSAIALQRTGTFLDCMVRIGMTVGTYIAQRYYIVSKSYGALT